MYIAEMNRTALIIDKLLIIVLEAYCNYPNL